MAPPSEAPALGVAIPAAGYGTRMGGARKAFVTLDGAPLLELALRPFLTYPGVRSLVVALPLEDAGRPPAWLQALGARVRVVAGGETRLHSVLAAIEALDPKVDWVLIHDAARPLVTRAVIDRCVDAAHPGEGVVAGWPVSDSLKEVDDELVVLESPDRSRFWRAQTPQLFPRKPILDAYRRAVDQGVFATDDAELFCRFGGRVRMVRGSPWNLKVTHREDLAVARYLHARSAEFQEGE